MKLLTSCFQEANNAHRKDQAFFNLNEIWTFQAIMFQLPTLAPLNILRNCRIGTR